MIIELKTIREYTQSQESQWEEIFKLCGYKNMQKISEFKMATRGTVRASCSRLAGVVRRENRINGSRISVPGILGERPLSGTVYILYCLRKDSQAFCAHWLAFCLLCLNGQLHPSIHSLHFFFFYFYHKYYNSFPFTHTLTHTLVYPN